MDQESQKPQPEQETTEISATASVHRETTLTVSTSGKRQAFRDIRRQLQETELGNPGVQKLLLDELETAESECEVLQGYVDRYHEADKKAAILEERLKTHTALEI